MWCTVCRAPIIADPSKGSKAKLQVLSQLSADDIAHLSSAHGFSYGHKTVAQEYFPFNEELSLLAEGEKYGPSMSVYQNLDGQHTNWLLHTACLNILLRELGLTEENMKAWHQRALFEYRSHLGLYGEFIGMRDSNGPMPRYVVSSKNKPLMKRLDWGDGLFDAWKFCDPNSNEKNSDRIIQTAKLIQRIRVAAGDPSPELTRRCLQFRNNLMAAAQRIPIPMGPHPRRTDPAVLNPVGDYATAYFKDGAPHEGFDIALAKLYPRVASDSPDVVASGLIVENLD